LAGDRPTALRAARRLAAHRSPAMQPLDACPSRSATTRCPRVHSRTAPTSTLGTASRAPVSARLELCVTASLDRAIWFHRAAFDDWLLYELRGGVADGRGPPSHRSSTAMECTWRRSPGALARTALTRCEAPNSENPQVASVGRVAPNKRMMVVPPETRRPPTSSRDR
jgi:hypothetical protein